MHTQDASHPVSRTRAAASAQAIPAPPGVKPRPTWSSLTEKVSRWSAAGSTVGKTGPDPKTVGLLITATEYAVAAVHRMILQATGRPEALEAVLQQYVDLVFGLEVNFVFPNLAGRERELLVSLMKVRNALSVQMSGLPQWRTPAQKVDHDRLTSELKSEFATLCSQVRESNLEDRLDPVQQTVLKEEFLSVVLDKEDNTKFFFRRRPGAVEEAKPNAVVSFRRSACSGAAKTACAEQPVKAGQKILIIDRSEHEARRIAGWLSQSGYESVVGIPGFESCRQAMKEKPDLILLEFTGSSCDWPSDTVLDGETTFKVLARIPKAQGTPVLGMVSQNKPTARDEALQSGARACLSKPLDRERLLNAVRVALDDLKPNPCATLVSAAP